jgi:hypothetical protein
MKLNREKANHIAKLIVDELDKDDRVKLLKDSNETRIILFKKLLDQLQIEDDIDNTVRHTLDSYSKKITEGTGEWDVMYAKLFEEEMNKRNL